VLAPTLDCCGGACTSQSAETLDAWRALGFDPTAPHRYTYATINHGTTFEVVGQGDLDCDGQTSHFTMTLTSDGTCAPPETSTLTVMRQRE